VHKTHTQKAKAKGEAEGEVEKKREDSIKVINIISQKERLKR
jgi:hypothetical protein